jgi:two-component system chemotaxis family response regulator WspR
MSYRDPLTDLHNRRYFEEHFQREWERARRNRQPLALVLIDLDHFKAYNDQYGHPAGDAALIKVAELLSRCANRATDIVARLGGEEFGIVLPDATGHGADEVARRVLTQLVAEEIPHAGAPNKIMTLSAGVAAIEGPEGPGPAELFEQADRALYEAKRRGRNGTVRHGEKTANVA